jgi:hypothetical protein
VTSHRGVNGLANYALFYGVDAVVFLEGGACSYALSDVCTGAGSSDSEDMRYWQVIFGRCLPGKSLRFRAVGAKSTLLAMDDLLGTRQVPTVYLAMDRDADALSGRLHPVNGRAFYTWGYSWENDLAFPALIARAALSACPVDYGERRAGVEADVAAKQSQFLSDARRFVQADTLLRSSVGEGLFDTQTARSHVSGRADPRQVPAFDVRNLRARLREKNRRHRALRPRRSPLHQVDVHRDCYGHLLEHLSFGLVRHSMKVVGYNSEPLAFDIVTTLLVGALRDLWDDPTLGVLRAHHETQFAPA